MSRKCGGRLFSTVLSSGDGALLSGDFETPRCDLRVLTGCRNPTSTLTILTLRRERLLTQLTSRRNTSSEETRALLAIPGTALVKPENGTPTKRSGALVQVMIVAGRPEGSCATRRIGMSDCRSSIEVVTVTSSC